jgi:hypothetical protein
MPHEGPASRGPSPPGLALVTPESPRSPREAIPREAALRGVAHGASRGAAGPSRGWRPDVRARTAGHGPDSFPFW